MSNALILLDSIRVYLSLTLVFSLLTISGLISFYKFYPNRNKALTLGGGMAFGVLFLILLMEILSYFFKGYWAIRIIYFSFTLPCLYIFLKNRDKVRGMLKTRLRWPEFLLINIIVAFYITIFFLFARSSPTGGDVSTHWSIATSFARGNYPTVLPPQPDFLTAYHQGAFVAEGVLHAVAGVNISIIHYIFSTYVISALFLFVLGMAREKTRSFVSFIPAILVTVVFGGPVIYTGSLTSFFSNFINIATTLPVNFEDMVLSLGTSANSVDALYYFNFYTLGLLTLLIIIFLAHKYKDKHFLRKYMMLTVLLVLTLSIAEVFFILGLVVIAGSYLIESRRYSFKNFILRSLILISLFLLLFFTIQNMVRDSMISTNFGSTWSPAAFFGSSDFRERIDYMKQRTVNLDDNISWLLPELRLLLIITFVLSLIYKSRYSFLLSVMSLTSVILSFTFINSFWRPASLRFINQAYHLLLLAVGFLMISIYLSRNKYSKVLFVMIMLLILPQGLVRNYKFIARAIGRDDGNLVRHVSRRFGTLEWIERNIPYNKRIIFIDEYPIKLSSLTHDAMAYHGIFVPTGPVNYKMVSIDYAGEWYDAVTNLDSRALKDLKVDYVFIKNGSTTKFSQKRLQQIQNRDYFYPIYANGEGTFYEVNDSFKQTSNEELTLTKITQMIPDGKIVYIDRLPVGDARKAILLLLAERTKLLGPLPGIGYDYFFYIEADLPIIRTDIKNAEKLIPEMQIIDYVITGDNKDPNLSLEGEFVKLVEIPFIALWENTLGDNKE